MVRQKANGESKTLTALSSENTAHILYDGEIGTFRSQYDIRYIACFRLQIIDDNQSASL